MWPLTQSDRKPWLLRFRSSPSFIVASVTVAIFTDLFLYAVMVPVLPFSLKERIGVPQDEVQSYVSYSLTVFAAALLVSSPIWGYVADHTQNRRTPMLVGLAILLAASVLLCFSVTIGMMMVGRIAQGLSGALIWSVGLAMIIDSVDRDKIGEAMGWVGSSVSLALLVGPFLGGVIYGHLGYYAVFVVCFAILGVDIAMRVAIIEVKTAKKWYARDEAGDAPSECDRLLPAAESRTDNCGEIVPSEIQSGLAIGGVGRLLSNPRTLAALWATVVEAIIHTSFESTLPLIVSTTFGWSSVGAGLIFLPIALPNFLGPVIGAIGDRYGPKWLTSCAFLVLTPLLLCFQFVTENTIEHQMLLYSLLTGVGLCMACIMGPLMAEITWSIQGDVSDSAVVPYAMAYGLYNAAFSIGGIIGPIIGGLVRDRVGMWAVGVIFGTTTACTSIACALFTGGPLRKRGMTPSPTLE